MTSAQTPGGNRRIDRVLDPEFVIGLSGLSLEELRARRQEADQEEVDLSYVRRMLQARADIAQAELDRRGADGTQEATADGDVVSRLSAAFGEEGHDRSPAQGLGRYRPLEPSRVGETRRAEEALVAASGLDDPEGLSDDALAAQMSQLAEQEQAVSAQRKQVQAVLDELSAEVTRRYRDGSASVDALLQG